MQHESDEHILVQQCLSGSKKAWDELYERFFPLVTKVARTRMRVRGADLQDTVQIIFLSLYTALGTYNSQYPLSKFVWTVAERACIDEYRSLVSAKRYGDTIPVDHHDGGDEGTVMMRSDCDPPDKQLANAEMIGFLRQSFRHLGDKCREILRLRYLEELPFKEMATILGVAAKTLAVQAGRCLDELRERYARLERKGMRP